MPNSKSEPSSLYSQKGIAHLVLLLLVLAGIILGAWLIGKQTNIIPHADEGAVTPAQPQYLSNKILVKFKQNSTPSITSPTKNSNHQTDSQASGTIKIGMSDFDTFVQKNQIISVEPLIPQNQNRIQTDSPAQAAAASELSRWYSVGLSGAGKAIDPNSADFSDLTNTINNLKQLPEVETAEPDMIYSPQYTPNDPDYQKEWQITNIHAQEAWDITKGNPSVKVAVLDTGVDSHPDLQGKVVNSLNLVTSSPLPWPSNDPYGKNVYIGHGVSSAGVIAANIDNSIGVAGISPNVSLLDAKILNEDVTGASNDAVIQAITWAADNGASVISMSFGGPSPTCSVSMQEAINYAWNKNAVLVAAAGNFNTAGSFMPGGCKHVVSVGAVDTLDQKASFSNYGAYSINGTVSSKVALAAPGVSIYTTLKPTQLYPQEYGYYSGTSASAPVVAAVAALVKSANPSLTNSAIVSIIESTADKIAYAGGDYWEYGRVNAGAAVNKAAHLESPIYLTAEATCKNSQPAIDLNFNDIAPGGTSDLSVQYTIQSEPNIFKNALIPGKLSLRPLTIDSSIANITPGQTYQVSIKASNNIVSNKVPVTMLTSDCQPAPTPTPTPNPGPEGPGPFHKVIESLQSVGSEISIPNPSPGPNNSQPVYQIYSTKDGNIHFFTLDYSEANGLVQTKDWTPQEIGWYAYPNQAEGTEPIYEIYRKDNGNIHFFTADKSEADGLLASGDWLFQRVAFYAYSSAQPETVPVYEIYRKDNGNIHYFTTNKSESDGLVATGDWIYQRIAFYAYKK